MQILIDCASETRCIQEYITFAVYMDKILSTGRQEFSDLIRSNCIYVDKTDLLYRLVTQGKYYFLSRPRRFGKSLTVTTLKELFLGNKELFRETWLYHNYPYESMKCDPPEWKKHPIIHISFADIDYNGRGLAGAIDYELSAIAKMNDIRLEGTTFKEKFRELIREMGKETPVVILIDEYDKPIIDYLERDTDNGVEKAEENRDILKRFYSVIKGSDLFIRFFFVTGVSKFSHVSIFSDLNHLTDITIDKHYATLTGYTREEITRYFSSHIKEVRKEISPGFSDLISEIEYRYNGYSWDGSHFVMNPFSFLTFLGKREFGDYWFKTGTPTFLTRLIKKQHFDFAGFIRMEVEESNFDKYEINDLSLPALLFQTGYLTIKSARRLPPPTTYTLDFPNMEVASAFSRFLLVHLCENPDTQNKSLLKDMVRAFNESDMDEFVKLFNALVANITYHQILRTEPYFHSLFYIVMKMLGYEMESEILFSRGRIDAVIFTKEMIYILEFKVNQSAQEAIAYIKKKGYPDKYAADRRKKALLGINFSPEKKGIAEMVKEEG